MNSLMKFVKPGILLLLLITGLFLFEDDKLPSTKKWKKYKFAPRELFQQQWEAKREKRLNGGAKYEGPDQWAKYQRAIRTRFGATGPEYGPNYLLNELRAAKSAASRARRFQAPYVSEWKSRGPFNVPGRTRGLIVHPDDPQSTWFAGSVGGGIWKTTNAGETWVNKTPDLPNLSTTVLALSPSDPNIIYAGTGEGFFATNFINGSGIFKSIDGGETWSQLSFTADNLDFVNTNRIIVDPQNPDILLACTNSGIYDEDFRSGIYRSTDGGQTFAEVYFSNSNRVQQLIFSPTDFNTQYAAVFSVGVLKSTDGGLNWENSSDGLLPSGRIEIAIAPTDPNILYAMAEGGAVKANDFNEADFYTSINGGETWDIVLQDTGDPEEDYLGGQGWYDNTIAVHLYDPQKVYFGGVNMWRAVMKPDSDPGEGQVLGVDEEYQDEPFIEFINFGGAFFNGNLEVGSIPDSLFATVEIRLGGNNSQMAHRFIIPDTAGTEGDGGAGVPDSLYIYQDYVEVPFEAWDITNNRQLMVSFRDQENDGVFDLEERSPPGEDDTRAREYIFIHATNYDTEPEPEIASDGGHVYQQMYFLWPTLAPGASWNVDPLPEANIRIRYGLLSVRRADIINITDAYEEFSERNVYLQPFATGEHRGIHPDHHNLITIPVDVDAKTFFILNANDGGVYYSNTATNPGINDGDWNYAGDGFITSQFYGADKHPGEDEYIGGMQDNGTWRSPAGVEAEASTNYLAQLGGDGFESIWNYADGDEIIGSIQFNQFLKTEDGGETWFDATNGLTDVGRDNAPFVSNLTNSTANPDIIFTLGESGVWKSENFGTSWNLAAIANQWEISSTADVKVSLANDRIVWAGGGMSPENRVYVSTDRGNTFTAVNNYTATLLGGITGLATHPVEDSTAYALFSFANAPKILRTTDLGETWEDISGFEGEASTASTRGFPDIAVHSLLVLPHNPDIIWAGTEIGIVESTDNGESWNFLEDVLPATAIWNMKVVDDQVVMATHGRGIWTATIPELPPVVLSPQILASGISPKGGLNVRARLLSDYDSTQIFVNQLLVDQFGAVGRKDTILNFEGLPTGFAEIQLLSWVNNQSYLSTSDSTIYFDVKDYSTFYSNNFNESSDDFVGFGFEVTQPDQFENPAIHSLHPYGQLTDYYFTLKQGIIVYEENDNLFYEDIALIEPGEDDAPFGSEDFFDYVVVEGTTNGLDWIPLDDGYDARLYSEWLSAYESNADGTPALFQTEKIDLLQTYAPGDTILIRFHLFSDPLEVGWGWAIDNIFIQEEQIITSAPNELQARNFSLRSYPNPFQGETNISYYLPERSDVQIRIYDINGSLIESHRQPDQYPGEYNFRWEARLRPGGIYLINVQTSDENKTIRVVLR